MLIVTAYHPQRITDMLRYTSLGLHTVQQFSAQGWLTYDVAFCKDAAARGLSDWSSLIAELFNFHVTSVQVASPSQLPPTPPPGLPPVCVDRSSSGESRGTDRSHVIRGTGGTVPVCSPCVAFAMFAIFPGVGVPTGLVISQRWFVRSHPKGHGLLNEQ